MAATAATRVMIADHEREVRQALRLLCEEGLDLQITWEAADVSELRPIFGAEPPAILLLEWELPGLHARTLLDALRPMGVIVIALSGRPEARTEALEAGVDGFIYKGDPPDALVTLLRAVTDSSPTGAVET